MPPAGECLQVVAGPPALPDGGAVVVVRWASCRSLVVGGLGV